MDREYLKKCLVGYKQQDQTVREIMQVLVQYRGLVCRSAPFVFNDGRSQDLACLEGTIPVSFKGVYYNIPIAINLLKTYPNHPPICYVKPTNEMNIKTSMYVDQSGKIYLPYLSNWTPSNADLSGLIQVMILTFGDHPPVFSKPKDHTTSGQTAPYPQQGYMPMPGMSPGGFPPYPQVSGFGAAGGVRGPAPYPPYPSHGPTSTPFSTQPSPYPAQPSPYPNQSSPYSGQPSPYGGQQTPYSPQPYPSQPHLPTPTPSQDNSSNSSGTITEEHIRLSLISAIEHKVKRRLEEQVGQQKAELEILKQTSQELSQGKNKIQALIDKLSKEKMELERNISLLKDKDLELDKCISELNEENEIDVDEAVTTTAPLYKQLVNSYAEEAATEDAIYYMGEGLRRGVIDLDVFLKQVRFLSRKQFMLRALMQKCRLKAGLAG